MFDWLEKAREREAAKERPLVECGILEFCVRELDFKPTSYQERLLLDPSRFVVARWSRQSGKSYAVAALILYHALTHPGSRIAVLAPSLRQSRWIIWRISSFVRRLRRRVLAGRLLRTRLDFVNRSVVEAFPNSPETVRGQTLDLVFVDEWGYIQNDEELYTATVFALATTNGRFVATSTPGSRETLFYEMCTDDVKYRDVSRHHVSYREALEPNGPLKREILEQLRVQMEAEPWRWRREMEAEFADDEDAWLPMDLISNCVDENLEYISETSIIAN